MFAILDKNAKIISTAHSLGALKNIYIPEDGYILIDSDSILELDQGQSLSIPDSWNTSRLITEAEVIGFGIWDQLRHKQSFNVLDILIDHVVLYKYTADSDLFSVLKVTYSSPPYRLRSASFYDQHQVDLVLKDPNNPLPLWKSINPISKQKIIEIGIKWRENYVLTRLQQTWEVRLKLFSLKSGQDLNKEILPSFYELELPILMPTDLLLDGLAGKPWPLPQGVFDPKIWHEITLVIQDVHQTVSMERTERILLPISIRTDIFGAIFLQRKEDTLLLLSSSKLTSVPAETDQFELDRLRTHFRNWLSQRDMRDPTTKELMNTILDYSRRVATG